MSVELYEQTPCQNKTVIHTETLMNVRRPEDDLQHELLASLTYAAFSVLILNTTCFLHFCT